MFETRRESCPNKLWRWSKSAQERANGLCKSFRVAIAIAMRTVVQEET